MRGRSIFGLAFLLVFTISCKGDPGEPGATGRTGDPGPKGDPAVMTGVINGTVTDGVAQAPLADVEVKATDAGDVEIAKGKTDQTGKYSLTVPLGTLRLSFTKDYYTSPAPLVVGTIADKVVTVNAAMTEAQKGAPAVTLMVSGHNAGYGKTATVTANGTDPNGDTLTYQWSNATLPVLGKVEGTGNTGTITMPTMTEAMSARADKSNPGMFIPGYKLEDRFGVLPIFPDARGQLSAKVVVSDGRGQSTTATVTVNATSVQSGLRNVALNTRVYLNSGKDTGNAWTLTAKPSGSNAALDDAAARTPSFIPDIAGTYTIKEGTNTIDIIAGKWKGAITGGSGDGSQVDSACTTCHDGSVAADLFTPWLKTNHAQIFARGINGGSGTSGTGCMDCHTVGYDVGVTGNNGFDDVAKEIGWSWPKPAPGSWGNMMTTAPQVARLANIQCESCHGPNDSTAHKATKAQDGSKRPYLSSRISYGAENCAACHGRTSHHLYSEWVASTSSEKVGHSNRVAAVTIGARGGTLYGHCGRCHSAQGYVQFADNLLAGTPGNINKNLTDVTAATIEPITCVACHDPHDAKNPEQLRIYNDTPMLPAGFAAKGLGKGALCVTCHNSRNGMRSGSSTLTYLHEDGETYNNGNPTGFSAPHQAGQGDVFTGHNAYFMTPGGVFMSKHSSVEDSCVGCHMELQTKTYLSHGSDTPQTHRFRIDHEDVNTLCKNCHGKNVTAEGVQSMFEAGMHKLEAKIAEAVKTKINCVVGGKINVVAYDAATDLYSASSSLITIDIIDNPVTAVGLEEGHGQVEFHLTFTKPVPGIQFVDGSGNPVGAPKSMTEFGVQMGSLKDGQTTPATVYKTDGNMIRACWNYFLLHGDASEGLHNPSFSMQVINNTLAKDLSY